ncbi:AbrB/MazE/SpoVT family DNA-binding domain-containing protein [Desulfofundulus salinus]|uniref:AbrB/MazE/SpoVT family DNA-binding domain-containing protein n=1 Tax=Desulfofundulus salinus TaxID=2419843 RepID=A0A494WTZ9_9FIRM|nr:AbrB/MazE/SpoVT family DNA-binding domain-containing protein [Desulfofundulus salinum]RKO66431.1 AbrB/MazE/SpoVT family DNA-binding domain-containing protein [Desulfofundulus salinum]
MTKKLYTPKVGPKGLMTLPKQIRTALGIEEGDRVLLKVEPGGKVVLEKALIFSANDGASNSER